MEQGNPGALSNIENRPQSARKEQKPRLTSPTKPRAAQQLQPQAPLVVEDDSKPAMVVDVPGTAQPVLLRPPFCLF